MLRSDHHKLRRKLIRVDGMKPAEAFDFVVQKARDEQQDKKRGKK